MLTKSTFLLEQRQDFKEDVIEKLNEAAQLEISLAYKILDNTIQIITFSSTIDRDENNNMPGNFIQINLNPYLNNKGLSNILSATNEVDLTGTGEYLFIENPIDSNLIIENIPLIFSEIDKSMYDNVSCIGQLISVPQNRYKRVILMWCSEWGDSAGYVTMNQSNGQSIKQSFSLSDMCLRPQFKESIALSMKCVNKRSLQTKDAYLFLTKLNLELENELVSIQLPKSPNMHVIALSLEL